MLSPESIERERIRAARAYAQWHLGDPSWADAMKALAEEKKQYG
jgi:hypothetical protein